MAAETHSSVELGDAIDDEGALRSGELWIERQRQDLRRGALTVR
jgi:hypothetical protein